MTEKRQHRRGIRLWSVIILAVLGLGAPSSHGGVLLECKLKEGYPEVKIYINESDGYVLYNAQVRETYERERSYKSESGPVVVDEGLDITMNNDQLILAHDDRSSIVIVKKDASFAYAWTTPVPLPSGELMAFGNNTSGTCAVNPFSRDAK